MKTHFSHHRLQVCLLYFIVFLAHVELFGHQSAFPLPALINVEQNLEGHQESKTLSEICLPGTKVL